MSRGDFREYMRLDAATRDDLAAELTPEQVEQAGAAVQAAKLKTDSKTLPDHLIAKLRNLRERNHFDVFIFSYYLCASNRARGQEDPPHPAKASGDGIQPFSGTKGHHPERQPTELQAPAKRSPARS